MEEMKKEAMATEREADEAQWKCHCGLGNEDCIAPCGDDEAEWERFYASDYFKALIAQAKARIAAGETSPIEGMCREHHRA